jgi:hypothetical protein
MDEQKYRALVCGGREYSNQAKMFRLLDVLKECEPNLLIIHGGAKGADSLGGQWALDRGVEVLVFPADWDQYGRGAGFIRNAQMLKEGKPNLVVAFSGGRGTEHMIQSSEKAGVEVVVVREINYQPVEIKLWCDEVLEKCFGLPKAEAWWDSNNKAFNNRPPIEAFKKDLEGVVTYLQKHIGGLW